MWLAGALILLTASVYDLKCREIPQWLNVLILLAIPVVLVSKVVSDANFILFALLCTALAFFFYSLGITAEADGKLLILSSLILASSPDIKVPILFFCLSYFLFFITPSREGMRILADARILTGLFLAILLLKSYFFFVLLVLFSLKMIEGKIYGFSREIPVSELKSWHSITQAVKGGSVVDISDADLIFRRSEYEYIPPLCLEERDVEEVKNKWTSLRETRIKVRKEAPMIPAMTLAYVLFPIFWLGHPN